jgi:two-component system, OmpR family, alkaline phosphatase synthesis response regulator PhoP
MMHRLTTAAPPKILCVDDDTYLTDLLQYALARDGYNVSVAADGATALRLVQSDPPDAVLLDLHLPDVNGLTLCGQLRREGHMPVIMLTASHTDTDIVKGFQHGADDYIVKPFSMQILSYRIQAVLRRSRGAEHGGPQKTRYELGKGSFDAEQHEVLCKDTRIKLTPIQGKILRLLLDNEGRVISSEQIMSRIWHYDAESDVSVVKTHISNLRKRLAAVLGSDDLIRTVAGLGYMLRQSS